MKPIIIGKTELFLVHWTITVWYCQTMRARRRVGSHENCTSDPRSGSRVGGTCRREKELKANTEIKSGSHSSGAAGKGRRTCFGLVQRHTVSCENTRQTFELEPYNYDNERHAGQQQPGLASLQILQNTRQHGPRLIQQSCML